MTRLFTKCGGYRALHGFTYATLIHLGTIAFCKRFVTYRDDPLGKTAGQMVGAARSGRQNIIEGSERAATSRETEIKLTDVARASLGELLGDLEIYLAGRNEVPWSRQSEEYRRLAGIQVAAYVHTDDELHDYWVFLQGVRAQFAEWLESDNGVIAANALIILTQRAMGMLSGQVRRLGAEFQQEGGFRERMHKCRTEARGATEAAPACPECGQSMRLRTAQAGSRAGEEFWGCSGYPACKGTRRREDA